MHRNQKRCLCGHVAAAWDTHVEACRSCCGCSRELPCEISKSWSPSTWEKMASARLHSSRRGKASGSVKRADSSAAATSQGTPTSVVGALDSQVVASQSTPHAAAGGATDTVSRAGKSLSPASSPSLQTGGDETSAAHRSSSVLTHRSPVTTGHRSLVSIDLGSPVSHRSRPTGHQSDRAVQLGPYPVVRDAVPVTGIIGRVTRRLGPLSLIGVGESPF